MPEETVLQNYASDSEQAYKGIGNIIRGKKDVSGARGKSLLEQVNIVSQIKVRNAKNRRESDMHEINLAQGRVNLEKAGIDLRSAQISLVQKEAQQLWYSEASNVVGHLAQFKDLQQETNMVYKAAGDGREKLSGAAERIGEAIYNGGGEYVPLVEVRDAIAEEQSRRPRPGSRGFFNKKVELPDAEGFTASVRVVSAQDMYGAGFLTQVSGSAGRQGAALRNYGSSDRDYISDIPGLVDKLPAITNKVIGSIKGVRGKENIKIDAMKGVVLDPAQLQAINQMIEYNEGAPTTIGGGVYEADGDGTPDGWINIVAHKDGDTIRIGVTTTQPNGREIAIADANLATANLVDAKGMLDSSKLVRDSEEGKLLGVDITEEQGLIYKKAGERLAAVVADGENRKVKAREDIATIMQQLEQGIAAFAGGDKEQFALMSEIHAGLKEQLAESGAYISSADFVGEMRDTIALPPPSPAEEGDKLSSEQAAAQTMEYDEKFNSVMRELYRATTGLSSGPSSYFSLNEVAAVRLDKGIVKQLPYISEVELPDFAQYIATNIARLWDTNEGSGGTKALLLQAYNEYMNGGYDESATIDGALQ